MLEHVPVPVRRRTPRRRRSRPRRPASGRRSLRRGRPPHSRAVPRLPRRDRAGATRNGSDGGHFRLPLQSCPQQTRGRPPRARATPLRGASRTESDRARRRRSRRSNRAPRTMSEPPRTVGVPTPSPARVRARRAGTSRTASRRVGRSPTAGAVRDRGRDHRAVRPRPGSTTRHRVRRHRASSVTAAPSQRPSNRRRPQGFGAGRSPAEWRDHRSSNRPRGPRAQRRWRAR